MRGKLGEEAGWVGKKSRKVLLHTPAVEIPLGSTNGSLLYSYRHTA